MARTLLVLILLVGLAISAEAAGAAFGTKAWLLWDASVVDGSHSAPTSYTVKCGSSSGVYTLTDTVTAPTTKYRARNLVGHGTWYCVVTASNASGETDPSNEVVVVR